MFKTINDTVTTGVVRDRMLSRKGIIVIYRMLVVMLVVCSRAAAPGTVEGQTVVDPGTLEALYSLEFDEAEQSFLELTRRNPENPDYWNLLASSIWLEIVFEQEKLNLDSYTGGRIGTSESTDLVSPEREERLREVLGRARAAAENILEGDPENVDALYALGMSHGTLASFEATVKRGYLAAHREAKKAREYHMRLLRLDPSYNDARLTVGTYDYAVGVIPGWIRFLLSPFGIRGDKEQGIQQLEYAAELGDRAKTNAKMVLVVVYNREKQYEKALRVLEELHATYPRNYLLEVGIASVYGRMEYWDAAIETYESVIEKMATGQDDYDRFEPEPILFKIGEAQVHSLRSDDALVTFRDVVSRDGASDNIKARSHIWMGKLFDEREERGLALAEYAAVLRLDCSEDFKKEARNLQRHPAR